MKFTPRGDQVWVSVHDDNQMLDLSETEVIHRLSQLKQRGLVKRLGGIVNHRNLGYLANAMVVFDIPNAEVKQIGEQISQRVILVSDLTIFIV